MRQTDLPYTPDPEAFLNAARDQNLEVMETTLASYPGARHWHFSKPGSRGVIEATWWPSHEKFWLSVHENRGADWVDDVYPMLVLAGGSDSENS